MKTTAVKTKGNPEGCQELRSQVRTPMELTQAALLSPMVGNPEGPQDLWSQVRTPMELT